MDCPVSPSGCQAPLMSTESRDARGNAEFCEVCLRPSARKNGKTDPTGAFSEDVAWLRTIHHRL